MAALPFRFTGEEPLLDKAEIRAAGDEPHAPVGPAAWVAETTAPAPRELTVRALAVGLAIGAVLAAGNVYTGLKSGFIDGGALTAALLSFTFFATFKRFNLLPFGPFENNIAQTAAASAAIMAFVHGLMGPMPALMMMGQRIPVWGLWAWGMALAVIGVATGVLLRRKLVVEEALPFPSGIATAELIRTVHADRVSASRRTRLLVWAAVGAAIVTWLRDGGPALIPQAIYLPLTIGGMTAASLTLGIAPSPLMAATGMFIGLRAAVSLLIGGIVAWGALAPVVVGAHWISDGSYTTVTTWLVWPALGMMLASTLVPLVLKWRSLYHALRRGLSYARSSLVPIRGLVGTGTGADPASGPTSTGLWVGTVSVLLAAAALAWTGWRAFGFSPYLTGAALILSVVLSAICARAAGETDIAPVGSLGTLAQILFAGCGPGGSILAGALTSGNSSETAQMLWAFKAGHSLRAPVRAQIVAQALGALVGSLVVVPAYLLVVRAYPLGSERMPAIAAVSWKATAIALGGGLRGLPPHALHAACIGFGLGAMLSLLASTRAGKFLPSALAMGVAMITPVSLSAAAVLGAGAILLARRRISTLADGETNALAAGLLAGESILGVGLAAVSAWRP